MSTLPRLGPYVIWFTLVLFPLLGAIQFDLGPDLPELCLSEDIASGSTIKGSFNIPDPEDHWDSTITLFAPAPSNRVLYSRQNVDNQPGDFTLPATENGPYKLCITARAVNRGFFAGGGRRGRRGPQLTQEAPPANTRRVTIQFKGDSALDEKFTREQAAHERDVEAAAKVAAVPTQDQLLRAQDLKPINMLLLRTETQLERLKTEFRDLRAREAEHRNTNESTNTRSIWFSVLTIGALLVLAAWQLLYMRSYFRKKKLI